MTSTLLLLHITHYTLQLQIVTISCHEHYINYNILHNPMLYLFIFSYVNLLQLIVVIVYFIYLCIFYILIIITIVILNYNTFWFIAVCNYVTYILLYYNVL